MIHVGPVQAREVLERLEAEIVDPDRAQRLGEEALDAAGAARVPAATEPPD